MRITRTISGYGLDYEHVLSKAKAEKLLGDKPLPRMGYMVDVAKSKQKCQYGSIITDSWAYLALHNISGTYVLCSCTDRKENWLELFNIDPTKL